MNAPPNPYAEGAPLYVGRGWVTPLPLPFGAKFPPPEGFTGDRGRAPSPGEVTAWSEDANPHNLGIRLPGNVIGVDVDDYLDKAGADELAKLEADLGPLPATCCSTSRGDDDGPGASSIRFYIVPNGTRIRAQIAPSIEAIQRHHRYAVAWPSVHPEGGMYRWYDSAGEAMDGPPHIEDLAELPWPWVEALRTIATTSSATVAAPEDVSGFFAANTESAHPRMLAGITTKLDDWTPGQCRHDTLLEVACWAMREAAAGCYSATEAEVVLRDWWHRVIDDQKRIDSTEFGDAIAWAVAQANADADRVAKIRTDADAHQAVDVPDAATVDLWGIGAHNTDTGNARRLVALYGHKIRWCPQRGLWLIWNGKRWQWDEASAVTRAAKLTAAAMGLQAWNLPSSTDKEAEMRKAAIGWSLATENINRLKAMLELARSEPGIAVDIDDLDTDKHLFNCTNGITDLRAGQLLAHDPKYLITKIAGGPFVPDAQAPRWQAFLERVLPDADLREFFQRLAGYCATGEVSEHKLFMAHGGGANGKTVALETWRRALGDYGDQAEPDLLMARRDAHPTGIAKLAGKRLVLAAESDDGRRLAEAAVKRLTGGDRITARFMNHDFFEFDPTHKIVMATNHKPTVRGTDNGIWRRLRLIPFTVTIPAEEQDQRLMDKLSNECDGILRWIIEGASKWYSDGLTEPAAVIQATADYRTENDTIGAFLVDCCDAADRTALVAAAELRDEYERWCEDRGEEAKSPKLFGAALTERGFDRMKYGKGRRYHWVGLRIVPEGEPMNPCEPIEPMTATRGRIETSSETKGSDGFMGSPQTPDAPAVDFCPRCGDLSGSFTRDGLCPPCSSEAVRSGSTTTSRRTTT